MPNSDVELLYARPSAMPEDINDQSISCQNMAACGLYAQDRNHEQMHSSFAFSRAESSSNLWQQP